MGVTRVATEKLCVVNHRIAREDDALRCVLGDDPDSDVLLARVERLGRIAQVDVRVALDALSRADFGVAPVVRLDSLLSGDDSEGLSALPTEPVCHVVEVSLRGIDWRRLTMRPVVNGARQDSENASPLWLNRRCDSEDGRVWMPTPSEGCLAFVGFGIDDVYGHVRSSANIMSLKGASIGRLFRQRDSGNNAACVDSKFIRRRRQRVKHLNVNWKRDVLWNRHNHRVIPYSH